MRRRAMLGAVTIVAASAVATGGLASADGAKKRTRAVTCKVVLTALVPPTATTGDDFGKLRCSRPFGSGVQYDTFKLTPSSDTTRFDAVDVTGNADAYIRFLALQDDIEEMAGRWRADYAALRLRSGSRIVDVGLRDRDGGDRAGRGRRLEWAQPGTGRRGGHDRLHRERHRRARAVGGDVERLL